MLLVIDIPVIDIASPVILRFRAYDVLYAPTSTLVLLRRPELVEKPTWSMSIISQLPLIVLFGWQPEITRGSVVSVDETSLFGSWEWQVSEFDELNPRLNFPNDMIAWHILAWYPWTSSRRLFIKLFGHDVQELPILHNENCNFRLSTRLLQA